MASCWGGGGGGFFECAARGERPLFQSPNGECRFDVRRRVRDNDAASTVETPGPQCGVSFEVSARGEKNARTDKQYSKDPSQNKRHTLPFVVCGTRSTCTVTVDLQDSVNFQDVELRGITL